MITIVPNAIVLSHFVAFSLYFISVVGLRKGVLMLEFIIGVFIKPSVGSCLSSGLGKHKGATRLLVLFCVQNTSIENTVNCMHIGDWSNDY